MIIIGMLHNLSTDRYHPITFRYAPPASGGNRYKSGAHHTNGFDTRDQAIACINGELAKLFPDFTPCLEKDFPWDGEGTPAMVVYFSEKQADGSVQPMF